MKTLDHTPGPWDVEHQHYHGTIFDDEMSGLGLELIGPPEAMRGTFAKSADARLVAAAPEMYDLLRRFVVAGSVQDVMHAVYDAGALLDRLHGEQEVKGGEE